jgi:hypothetical protein
VLRAQHLTIAGQLNLIIMLLLILITGGIALFALFYQAIKFFEKI